MALIDSICMQFVLQMGPIPATIDPEKGRKPPQNRFLFAKSAGQSQKQELNTLFSITSVSRLLRGTSLGQGWDTGQAGHESFLKIREKSVKTRT